MGEFWVENHSHPAETVVVIQGWAEEAGPARLPVTNSYSYVPWIICLFYSPLIHD